MDLEIPHDILPHAVQAKWWTQGLLHSERTGDLQSRHAFTDQQRCGGDLQTVQTPCIEKPGYRDAPALHKDAPQAIGCQHIQDVSWLQATIDGTNGESPIRVRTRQCVQGYRIRMQQPGGSLAIDQHLQPCRDASLWIDDDSDRIGTGNRTGGQLRIVCPHRSCADYHGMTQRAKPMQVLAVLLASDEKCIAIASGDACIDTLSQMAYHHMGLHCGSQHRKVQIQRISGSLRQPVAVLPFSVPSQNEICSTIQTCLRFDNITVGIVMKAVGTRVLV